MVRQVALLASLAAAGDFVKVLTSANFDDTLKEFKEGILVKYYAPWCGHCKSLAPEYEKAAEILNEKGSKYKLGKVDATEEAELGTNAGVKGYPTLKWYVDGKPQEFEGGRTADAIVEWIGTMTGPAVSEEEVDDSKKYVLLEAPEIVDWFESAAKSDRKTKWHFKKADGVKVSLKHPKEDALVASDVSDKESLEKFVASNLMPVFGAITGETFGQYHETKKGLLWLFPALEAADKVEDVVETYRPMAVNLKKVLGENNVAWTNTIEFKGPIEQMFGITEFPAAAYQKAAGDKPQWVFKDEDLTEENVQKWYAGIASGEIKPFMKSEDVPASQDEPVKVVVGKNFHEMVFQADKDVLLEVYAPWCGHCKKLEPEYNKVAKKLEKEGLDKFLMLAKLDGSANDSPDDNFKWTGFPTIFFVKAGAKEPISYEGGRDAKGIWKYLKKNSSKADEIAEVLKAKKAEKAADSDAAAKEEL